MSTLLASPTQPRLPVALRETADTVASLRRPDPPSRASLRHSGDAQLKMLREQLEREGQAREVIDDALYAQCALLDEAALNCLQGSEHDDWEREPLQVRLFGRNDAGEELLRRVQKRLREPQPNLLLLRIFAAVLKLGFTGQFAVNGAASREKLMREIEERLLRAGPVRDGGANGEASDPMVVHPPRRGRCRPSLATWVGIACVAAAAIWLAIDRWLLSSIDGMAH